MGKPEWDYNELLYHYEQLKSLAKKVCLCFPDECPDGDVAFNIPACVIRELHTEVMSEPTP